MKPERYRQIVLATDGSDDARTAVAFVAALEWPPGTTVAVLGVSEAEVPEETPLPETGVEQDARRYLELVRHDELARTQRFVAEAAALLRERRPGLAVEEVVRSGEPAAELLAALQEREPNLVVAGARGHNALHSLVLGSVSEALATEAPCPVLIVRDPPSSIAGLSVLIGIGGDDDAERLPAAVLRLPLPGGARFVAAAVEAAPGGGTAADDPELRRLAQTTQDWTAVADSRTRGTLDRAVDRLRAGAPSSAVESRLLAGDVASELLAAAAAVEADLIVVGARQRQGLLARLGLGSVSRQLVRQAACSMLVVRGDQPPIQRDGAG